MEKSWPKFDLTISQHDRGLLISQHGKAYIAKHWRLATPVIEMVEIALVHGLTSLIQNGAPQSSKLEPSGDGAEYLSFARKPNEYWVMVINDNSATSRRSRSDVNKVLFSKRYRHVLKQAEIPCQVEKFRNASNIEVPAKYAEAAIKACLPYLDIHAIRSGRRGVTGEYPGFRNEADIEKWLMENLNDQQLGRKIKVEGRQIRIDTGLMIDILLRDKESGELIVLEIKQGRAQPKDVEEQLQRYVSSPDVKNRAQGRPVIGCLVAELVESSVKAAVENAKYPVVAFEIQWHPTDSVTLKRVAGSWPSAF
jgi:hypothetical protein